ncbi:MAG: 4a-hydroxytetrahydrobiopterin dehydratase [bacterium]|nr:4a-hydroxytetrahydrobiopterin dehydratase [bacterium]MBU1916895.1 4a-hydroxytetrahydrobiopterin dehydratase [bacterium]
MENPIKHRKLSIQEIQSLLQETPGWVIEKNRLNKEFTFQNFSRAMIFVNKTVNPIEENQNYPRILILYNRVFISLFTNEVGALTATDFEMAKQFNMLAERNKA